MKFESKIGKTKYVLEETKTPRVLKVTRVSGDGEKEFFFPKDLIVEYIAYKGGAKMFQMTKDALSEALK